MKEPSISNAQELIYPLLSSLEHACDGVSCNDYSRGEGGPSCEGCPVGPKREDILKWLAKQNIFTKEFLLQYELDEGLDSA